jgi:hypothetical protein
MAGLFLDMRNMKDMRKAGKFLDGINTIKRIGGRRKQMPLKSF